MDLNLFTNNNENLAPKQRNSIPLAFSARPDNFNEYFGHENIFKKFQFLKGEDFPSIILYGPPGSGKTTLAHILAKRSNKDFHTFSPVLGGVNDLKKIIKNCIDTEQFMEKKSIIFIDEIHRFNKGQQDALLPYVENGSFTLIGATTENPRFTINNALISRTQLISLKKLEIKDIRNILINSSNKFNFKIPEKLYTPLIEYSDGDARRALNGLEMAYKRMNAGKTITIKDIKEIMCENGGKYDRTDSRHYDVISAFIKSMRGSDPNAAILWLSVMLDGGEDPRFIARRLIIFASEDVGNADPAALTLAVSTFTAVNQIGMPEARINLAQAVTYLASTAKSNAAYNAINEGMKYVKERETVEVPLHLRNNTPEYRQEYKYPHDYPGSFVIQKYTDENIPNFYRPTENGIEKRLKNRLLSLK